MAQSTDLTGSDRWRAVDEYIESQFTASDAAAAAVLANQREAGLPDIAVSPAQGKLLAVLARSIGARRVVEFGTLGGYSTLWLARTLPDDGELVTFELSQKHADAARRGLDAAGVGRKVTIRVGPALENLTSLADDDPFDLVFIDADKPNNVHYYEAAMTRVHPGTLIIVDNVVRGGALADADTGDANAVGARVVVERVAADPRVEGTVVQTVGAKYYDGMIVATVL